MILTGPLGGGILGRVGGSGLADPRPTLSTTPTSDTNDVAGTVTSLGVGRLRVALQNAAVATALPPAMALFGFSLKDLLGRSIDDSDDLDLGDIVCLSVWSTSAVAPTDVILCCGLAAGAVDNTDVGVAVFLVASAGSWNVQHSSATGTTWAAKSAATQTSALCVGAQLQLIMGTAGTQSRLSGIALDASGNPLTGTNFGTTPASVTTQENYDRGFVGVGWATGTGGTPADFDVGISAFLLRPREVAGFRPFDIGAPSAAPATYSKILLIGHSMGNGTVTSATWSGAAVQANWDFYEDTVSTDPYPAGTTPGVGMVPYLIEESNAFTRPATGTRWVARCATNGRAMGATGFDVDAGDAFTSIAARGADPDLIILWMGANDAQTAAEYELYSGVNGLIRIVRMLRYEYPNAVLVIMGERTTDSGVYPYIADGSIEAHKQAVAAQFPYTYYVSATSPSNVALADTIHPSDAGYADMAGRVFDVLP